MTLRVRETSRYILNMRARLPFRYGIATLVALPHLFVRTVVEIDGKPHIGVSSDGLPPKWFTKDPATTFAQDVAAMLAVIEHACELAERAGPAPTVFAFWQRLDAAQCSWGAANDLPPLLTGLGTSLVERAVLDAYCRSTGAPFHDAVHRNTLGIRLGEVHPALGDRNPAALLPPQPSKTMRVRHTIGLGDPLTDEEIPVPDRLDDGLPQSLAAAIRTYGLTHFKVKVRGSVNDDVDRLLRLHDLLTALAVDYRFTLDGNEQFRDVDQFRRFWDRVCSEARLAAMRPRLLLVEQPWPRQIALTAQVGRELQAWQGRPPLIIDESDGERESLPRALAAGYAGTSHKNCKGVLHSVANACLLEQHRRTDPSGVYLLSGEDLANVGPVALLQDLAVAATLGLSHVERNGHHYFRGLSMYPPDVQSDVLAAHSDLYASTPQGYATLRITSGWLALSSVNAAPFGLEPPFAAERYTPVSDWHVESLDG